MALSPAAIMATNQGNRTDWLNNSLSHRNLIINGEMDIYQRGSLSITQSNNGGFALDRFKYYQGSSVGQWEGTMSQHSMTSAELNTTGHAKALKIETTTHENSVSADESANVHQVIEAQNLQHLQYGTASAKSVTLSFWVKSSVTGTFAVGLYKEDSTDRIINKTITISDTNWNKYTLTFPGDTDSNATIVNDNGGGIHVLWHLFAGSDFNDGANTSWENYASTGWAGGHVENGILTTSGATWYLTGVQLELGNEATTFEHRSHADDLARCQRYFQMIAEGNGSPINVGIRYESNVYCYVEHPVTMRANPTIYASNASNHFRILMTGAGYTYSTPTAFLDQSVHRTQIRFGSFSGGSDGNGCWVQTNHADAYFGLNAEL